MSQSKISDLIRDLQKILEELPMVHWQRITIEAAIKELRYADN